MLWERPAKLLWSGREDSKARRSLLQSIDDSAKNQFQHQQAARFPTWFVSLCRDGNAPGLERFFPPRNVDGMRVYEVKENKSPHY